MKRHFYIILLLNLSWAIGLQGLVIPSNSTILSTAGTGIAANLYPALNPDIKISNHSFLQYSINNWLGGIKGSNTLFRLKNKYHNQISIQTWNLEDLELWGNSPADTPIEKFGTHYISMAYSMSYDFNNKYYGKYVQDYIDKGIIPIRVKLIIFCFIWSCSIFSIFYFLSSNLYFQTTILVIAILSSLVIINSND